MQLDWIMESKFQRLGLIRRSGRTLVTSKRTYSSSSFWQNSQASGRMMPTVFWLRRSTRSMRRPYSQPLLTSVRLLCSSSLQTKRKMLIITIRTLKHPYCQKQEYYKLHGCRPRTHSSSMLSSPKKAPSISLVMPFLCIFSDFSDSISLKVRLSTTLILLRFISLKWKKARAVNMFLHLAGDLQVGWEDAALTGTEAEEVWTLWTAAQLVGFCSASAPAVSWRCFQNSQAPGHWFCCYSNYCEKKKQKNMKTVCSELTKIKRTHPPPPQKKGGSVMTCS